MKLKVKKTISKRIITLEIETTSFTVEENKMLDILGEPIVSFKKIYGENFGVEIEKKIRTGFKVKVKFDGSDDIIKADEASDKFLEELPEMLGEMMAKLKDLYDEIEGKNENKAATFIDIKY